jgi:hypothetical protein
MPTMRVSDPTYDERKASDRVFVRFRASTALDCFIECANLGLRGWGSAARSPEPARPG